MFCVSFQAFWQSFSKYLNLKWYLDLEYLSRLGPELGEDEILEHVFISLKASDWLKNNQYE